jgi:hypothetical protein
VSFFFLAGIGVAILLSEFFCNFSWSIIFGI